MKQTEGTWTIKIDPLPNFFKIFVQKFFTKQSREQETANLKELMETLDKIFCATEFHWNQNNQSKQKDSRFSIVFLVKKNEICLSSYHLFFSNLMDKIKG